MQYALAVLAGLATLALAAPQGVTAIITPTAAAPAGCTANAKLFKISVTTLSKKAKRANTLEASLTNGVMTDNNGKRGYIAATYQLQFDSPVQDGAIYTAGFSLCANNTIALGGSTVFYECLSGGFYNIYNENWAPQCQPIFLDAIPIDGSVDVSTAAGTATTTGTPVSSAVSAVTSSAAAVTQISDAQPQGPTTTSAVTSSVVVVSSVVPVTSSAAAVTQISDNQPQAPTATTAVTSSIVVVSSSTITPVVSYSTTSVAIISQISDHQIQAPTATSASVTAYTGAASMPTMAAQLVLAAAGAAALML